MLRELTKTLFEIAFASLTGETKTGEKERLQLLEELHTKFEALSEAKTKTIAGKSRPAGDFLVVPDSDKPSEWALPVKVNGKPDRRLAGGAWAALFSESGFRGNVYEGPDKAGAKRRLRALYKAEGWDAPTAEVAMEEFGDSMLSPVFAPTALTFADMAAADEANQTADNVRHLSRRFQTLFGNVMFSEEVTDKMGAVRGLVDELALLMGETPTAEVGPSGFEEQLAIIALNRVLDATGEVQLGELHADGVAVEARDATEADLSEVKAAIESGRRSPVVVDFCILKPGPGNKKHNRYYPAGVVKRDIHVFEGVDVYATDHKEKERNERTKKGKVLQCPAYFTEDGSPIARTLIYDPDQAEKTRNRADANALNTMQCSIRGKGEVIPGAINGRQYSIVQEMTKGLYLDLVSKGGAGGHAQALVESENGGEPVKDKENKTTLDTDDVDTTEVDIEENEADQEPDETPVMLESAVVDAALAETRLPSAFKVALGKGEYADAGALQEAIDESIAEYKKATGSGRVVDLGESEPPEAQTLTVEEVHKRHDERVEAVFAEVGL